MGFDWDKYDGGGGGDFISAAEKKALAEAGAVFQITGVKERASRFEHDFEFVVDVLIPDGVEGVEPGERVFTFAKDSGAVGRDNALTGMIKHFTEEGGDDIDAKLAKIKRAWVLQGA